METIKNTNTIKESDSQDSSMYENDLYWWWRRKKVDMCKEKQYYRCTRLPAYQIRMFLTPRYRSFVCAGCIPVTKELSDIVKHQEESIVERLRRDVTACESIVKSLEINLKSKVE